MEIKNKYRTSWRSSSDTQRRNLCFRYGLQYTNVHDEILLQQVANRQQKEYEKAKQIREANKNLRMTKNAL